MVWFDRHHQKLVVRIVYDGPALAGKTTNLRRLCEAFSRQRRGELSSPEERDGRTRLFDWLWLDAGLVGGFGLRCHLLTVPGQARLAARRFRVLDASDVVVFVCDSSERGAREGKLMLELLRARMAGLDTPPTLVLQANKQDADGALHPAELAAALDLPVEVVAVAAKASEGVGVRETAVVAIRAAADRAQREILGRGPAALPDVDEDAGHLEASLRSIPEAPAFLRPRAKRRQRTLDVGAARRRELPPLPCADVATGHIWPATTGREVLRSIDREELARATDWHCDDSTGAFRLELGKLSMSTSTSLRFGDPEEARAALLRVAREVIRLPGPPGRRALCLVPEGSGYWLWDIRVESERLVSDEEDLHVGR